MEGPLLVYVIFGPHQTTGPVKQEITYWLDKGEEGVEGGGGDPIKLCLRFVENRYL